MSNRSWYYASDGQQHGPFSEAQFRDLIARGAVTAQTLVWSDGMAGWQKAGELPTLMSGGGSPPPMAPRGGAVMGSGGGYAAAGNALSVDFGIWEFVWRTIVYTIAFICVIPIPWAFVWYFKWIVSCIRVPGRPNLSFTGSPMTILPWFAGLVVLDILVYVSGIHLLNPVASVAFIVATWLLYRWQIANLASNGQPLGLSFTGSFWAYLGWNLLLGISFITIIGWAWVLAAQIRWYYRNIQGTRRAIVFKGSGLQLLWRSIVVALASSFIIPIPWMYRWIARWLASQTELVDRNAYAA